MSKTIELLISQNKGKDLIPVINNILENNEILNIEHLINNPNIQDIKNSHPKEFATLNLFSRGEYSTYKKDPTQYISLTEKMLLKLRKLSIVAISSTNKTLNIDNLKEILEIKDNFEMDKLLFDVSISEWVSLKVDHNSRTVKISEVKARDFISNWDEVESKLEKWIAKIEKVEELLKSQANEIRTFSIDYEKELTCCKANSLKNHALLEKLSSKN